MSLKYLLQALRLLNRATETLSRLNPKKPENNDIADPFAMPEVREALPETGENEDGSDDGSKVRRVEPISILQSYCRIDMLKEARERESQIHTPQGSLPVWHQVDSADVGT